MKLDRTNKRQLLRRVGWEKEVNGDFISKKVRCNKIK